MEALIIGAVLLIAAGFVWFHGPKNALVLAGVVVLAVVGAILVVLGLLDVADEGKGVDRDVVAPVGLWAAYRARRCLRSES